MLFSNASRNTARVLNFEIIQIKRLKKYVKYESLEWACQHFDEVKIFKHMVPVSCYTIYAKNVIQKLITLAKLPQ